MSGRSHRFPGIASNFHGVLKCLAQGHNTAKVGFEPQTLAPESDALPLSHHPHRIDSLYIKVNQHTRKYTIFKQRADNGSESCNTQVSTCLRKELLIVKFHTCTRL